MRVYVAVSLPDLERLERDGRLPADDRLRPLGVTPWVLRELGLTDPEDEEAEYAVLSAAADLSPDDRPAAAVLAFDVTGADPDDGTAQVRLRGDLHRRRLAALHLPPDLRWYAAQELPDVVAALSPD